MKQQQMDKPPKRVSLVGEDDLKKMKEEEGMLESVQGNLASLHGRHERAHAPEVRHFQKPVGGYS